MPLGFPDFVVCLASNTLKIDAALHVVKNRIE
jgi:hypothetical protein